ncbi:ABC transporter substrate-binding protein [Okeania sp.]|uniref:ABC transporter substrate-binding protein n=1 Tax=Okeania sp. TaxID=3100323 RepID=UPI002B4AAFD3|nr:ABC transporter substrate-binding protein [Okeania sp.]MEB3340444.1 ABC transporter substrate-binding protein [Okeania sp.]
MAISSQENCFPHGFSPDQITFTYNHKKERTLMNINIKHYISLKRFTSNTFSPQKWLWKLKQKIPLVLIFISFGVSLLISCNTTPLPLRVAINLWPGYETLYLARSLGYYENTLVTLLDFPSGTEQVRAFRNNNLESAAISMDQALELATTNPDVRIITVVDFSEGGDVILAKPEIPNLQALKGKRVGVEANALGAYIITRALEKAGMTIEDIQVVSLGLSEHERAFKDDMIDAVVTFGPARTQLLSFGAKEIFNSSQIPGEIVDVLISQKTAIANQSKDVQALVNGQFQALNYLAQNPQDSARRIAPRTQVTPEEFLEANKGLRRPSLQENQQLLDRENPALLETTQRLIDVMVANKLLSKSLDAMTLFDDRFVKAAKLE